MKQSRFIELLNLYVDQQLSPPEAAELEGEIARDPERRRTYQQYCRIQKGCTLLFEKERNRAPAHPALAAALRDADRKIVQFPSTRPSSWRTYASWGSVAAAACLAFVVVSRQSPGNPSAPLAATPTTAIAVADNDSAQEVDLPAAAPQTRMLGTQRPEFYSVLATRHLSTLPEEEADRLAAAAASRQLGTFAWMQDLELAPLSDMPVARLTLQDTSSLAQENRPLQARTSIDAEATEMSAFEFRR